MSARMLVHIRTGDISVNIVAVGDDPSVRATARQMQESVRAHIEQHYSTDITPRTEVSFNNTDGLRDSALNDDSSDNAVSRRSRNGAGEPSDAGRAAGEGNAVPGKDRDASRAKEGALASGQDAPVDRKVAPVDGKAAPVDGKAAPVDGKAAPVDVKATPVDKQDASATRQDAPANEQAAPIDGQAAPIGGQAAFVDKQATSSSERDAPKNEEGISADRQDAPPDGQNVPASGQAAAADGQDTSDDEDSPGDNEDANVAANNRFVCQFCNKLYTKKAVMNQHVMDRHVGKRCHWPGCGFTAATEPGLLQHFHKHQRDAVAQGVPKKKCPWPNCPKTYSRGDSVQRCVKRHNMEAARGQ
ncbi:hypothetical protein GGR51DRAFT_561904 [Nemania sp. FL0031]|nr:hypothetical protein GGR51DRAFT_561904 [Nemania sp. FL0031]